MESVWWDSDCEAPSPPAAVVLEALLERACFAADEFRSAGLYAPSFVVLDRMTPLGVQFKCVLRSGIWREPVAHRRVPLWG